MKNVDHVTVIAEAGVNHNGSLEQAMRLVDVAADAGADIVKFQTFIAAKLVSRRTAKAGYQARAVGAAGTQFDMLRRLELPYESFREIAGYCERRGVAFLSTPFDHDSLAYLCDELGMETVKISSSEVTNIPFLLACGRRGRAYILSTGMSGLGEVELALGALVYGALGMTFVPTRTGLVDLLGSAEGQRVVRERITILHCTSEYPAPPESINLRAIPLLRDAFGAPVGFSDHSTGIHIPVAAVALGASMIEKHFTLDRSLPGPDHAASLEPGELKAMIDTIRSTSLALGTGRKVVAAAEAGNRFVARKAVVAARFVSQGEIWTEDMLSIKRSSTGAEPMALYALLGRTAAHDFEPDEPVDL